MGPEGALLLGLGVLGLVALGGGSSSASSTSRGAGAVNPAGGAPRASAEAPHPVVAPLTYAVGKLPMMRARNLDEVGQLVRAWGPRVFERPAGVPAVSAECLLGFTAIGQKTEDTCGAAHPAAFHEVGYFQVPAGPCEGPAPNDDATAANNAWGALHRSPKVRQLLGDDATMVPGAWATDVRAQVAVGLANLAAGQRAVSRALPALAPVFVEGSSASGSVWGLWLAFSAFSAGPSAVIAQLRPYAAELGALDEDARAVRYLELLARAWARGAAFLPARRHPNPAYTALRTAQKFECGRALLVAIEAEATRSTAAMGDARTWWGPAPRFDGENGGALGRMLVAAAEGRA